MYITCTCTFINRTCINVPEKIFSESKAIVNVRNYRYILHPLDQPFHYTHRVFRIMTFQVSRDSVRPVITCCFQAGRSSFGSGEALQGCAEASEEMHRGAEQAHLRTRPSDRRWLRKQRITCSGDRDTHSNRNYLLNLLNNYSILSILT